MTRVPAPRAQNRANSRKLYPAFVALLLAVGMLTACKDKGRELPNWTPADHDNQDKPAPGQVDTKAKRPGMPDLEKQGINDVVLATWKQSCMQCHGAIGRGDGPSAVSFKPPNFTDDAWQRVALESEMEHTITQGRGPMPGFAHLPKDTVQGLIRLIRLMGAKSAAHPTPPTAESSSPTGTK